MKQIKEDEYFIYFDDGTAYDKEEHEFFEVEDERDIEEKILDDQIKRAQQCHCGAYQIINSEVIRVADCIC